MAQQVNQEVFDRIMANAKATGTVPSFDNSVFFETDPKKTQPEKLQIDYNAIQQKIIENRTSGIDTPLKSEEIFTSSKSGTSAKSAIDQLADNMRAAGEVQAQERSLQAEVSSMFALQSHEQLVQTLQKAAIASAKPEDARAAKAAYLNYLDIANQANTHYNKVRQELIAPKMQELEIQKLYIAGAANKEQLKEKEAAAISLAKAQAEISVGASKESSLMQSGFASNASAIAALEKSLEGKSAEDTNIIKASIAKLREIDTFNAMDKSQLPVGLSYDTAEKLGELWGIAPREVVTKVAAGDITEASIKYVKNLQLGNEVPIVSIIPADMNLASRVFETKIRALPQDEKVRYNGYMTSIIDGYKKALETASQDGESLKKQLDAKEITDAQYQATKQASFNKAYMENISRVREDVLRDTLPKMITEEDLNRTYKSPADRLYTRRILNSMQEFGAAGYNFESSFVSAVAAQKEVLPGLDIQYAAKLLKQLEPTYARKSKQVPLVGELGVSSNDFNKISQYASFWQSLLSTIGTAAQGGAREIGSSPYPSMPIYNP